MKIVYLPNAYEKTIINDFQNGVDMSTFLANGNILLKIFHRFLIFSADGAFISTVTFEDEELAGADKVEPEVPEEEIVNKHETSVQKSDRNIKAVAEGKKSKSPPSPPELETLADIIAESKR